jgi:hypothetical protein
MQWSEYRFEKKINDVILKKSKRYASQSLNVDVLLVHTAEPYLNSHQVTDWLQKISIKRPPNILSAFLLMDYEPCSKNDNWPLFELYGAPWP